MTRSSSITTLDLHTEGEPLRIITGGIAPVPGNSIVARRKYARENLDALRRSIMFEPRGHADMYGAILTEPVNAGSDLGVLFMHNEGWSSMCGHGIIALTTAVFEMGVTRSYGPPAAPPQGDVLRIDSPAGLIVATAHREGDRVARVSFENVPSFAYALDDLIDVPELGAISFDIGYGGAFYAYVDCNANPQLRALMLDATDYRELIDTGMAIKRAVMAAREIKHPFEPELSFLYGTIFYRDASPGHSRNVCVFAEGEVDRSPTGTGVSGRIALQHARGRVQTGGEMTIDSILGTPFGVRVLRETTFGPHKAVVPQVSGRAWVTGRCEFLFDPADPVRDGFILR